MADPGEGPGEPALPLILRPNCSPKSRKMFWTPPALSRGLDDHPPLLSQGLEPALVRVCLRCNWQCFEDHFIWFCCKFSENLIFFLQTSKRRQAKFCPSFWYLLEQLLHFPLKFHLSKLSRNERPFWIPSQNSEYPRIFWDTEANQNARKSPSTDLVNTNQGYSEVREPIKTCENCY